MDLSLPTASPLFQPLSLQLVSAGLQKTLNVGGSLASALTELIILACYPQLEEPTHFPVHSSAGNKPQKLLVLLAKQVKTVFASPVLLSFFYYF